MINVVKQMYAQQGNECRRAFDGPSLKAIRECSKARDERVALLLAELSIE